MLPLCFQKLEDTVPICHQGISWDKNALVGHSGGYSLKRLGKKATLDLFYSLCYTVITHYPKSHILSLGNSYKKRAPCSEHHHKYFVTQTEKTYNKYHEQENWLCYWLQKFWWTTTIQILQTVLIIEKLLIIESFVYICIHCQTVFSSHRF